MVDPEFPEERQGPNPIRGAPMSDVVTFREITAHLNERNFGCYWGGEGRQQRPLDPLIALIYVILKHVYIT